MSRPAATADAPPARKAYTRQEVADMSGLSYEAVKRAHYSGALRAKKSPGGGRYLYLASDVDEWLKSLPDG